MQSACEFFASAQMIFDLMKRFIKSIATCCNCCHRIARMSTCHLQRIEGSSELSLRNFCPRECSTNRFEAASFDECFARKLKESLET